MEKKYEKKYIVSLELIVDESQVDAIYGFLNGLLSSGEIEEYGEYLHSSIEVDEVSPEYQEELELEEEEARREAEEGNE